jgi:hypothetical protein
MTTAGTNPYAPPRARVVDPEPDSHGLKRRSVIVMVLLAIGTLGIYYVVWWFRRRPGLNRLNSPTKIALWPLLLLASLYMVNFARGFVRGIVPEGQPVPGELAAALFQLGVAIVLIVQSFKVKAIIEDHVAPDPHSGPMFGAHVTLSGVMTFFFSIFYLQWAINRYVLAPTD